MRDDDRLVPGLYEALVTPALERALRDLDERLRAERGPLHPAEAARRIALHLERTLERAIDSRPDRSRAVDGVRLARDLVAEIGRFLGRDESDLDAPVEDATVLRAILGRRPDGSPDPIAPPLTPLLDTTLLTNAPGEPRVGRQIETEIDSADRIDLLMAFIRRTGLRPLRDALERHVDRGRPLRVLTTTYTASTEKRALELLADLGADVRVSYDTGSTRLHAKAWLFHRDSSFSTAFVGSSNLTHSAQVTGLEWNVRVSGARNPDVVEKIRAVFETYWEGGEFVPFDAKEFDDRCATRDDRPQLVLSPVELRPEPFQARMLEQVKLSRRRGRHRNLIASATGTGKTVMAALDYRDLRRELPRARLLFVAHRKEILDKSRRTFAHALGDASFGELWVGGRRPSAFRHVFASIQSLDRSALDDLPADHFDVVIVDEFHHAAARSYDRLLTHLRPRELLGLTATPERADGQSVLHWFDGRIAAELRLWDAIDQHRLTPFQYYGIHDGLDLRDIPWRRGRGYDVEGLTNVYTADDAWVGTVLRELEDRVDDPARMRALGFCVSIDHARFMARRFEEAGIRAVALWGDSPADERTRALRRLDAGELRVVFSVDLFNEGVDLPNVDTLLLLRPTDSPTLFLQQLGRGLRRAPGKASCLVLDFVGHHRREFRIDRRLRTLVGGTRSEVEAQVHGGFPYLPAGCHMELDRVAREIVLEGLRAAVPSNWTRRTEELRALAASRARDVTLDDFLEDSGLEVSDLYGGKRCWSDLREAAGLGTHPAGPDEEKLRRALGRLLHLDDDVRIGTYRRLLDRSEPPDVAAMTERDRRLLRMLVAQLLRQTLSKADSLQDAADSLWRHPQVVAELRELLPRLADAAEHLPIGLERRPDVPLQVHARYTRDEILAAFDAGEGARVAPWQTGVHWVAEARADLLAFTLDKTGKSFSPTTRYRDHAISRELVHWESQSTTRAESKVGRRYRDHAALGSDVMLFARLRPNDRAFWFLGPATYVRHVGERPMAITWRLEHLLPGDLFQSFAAAVA
ncbi:MAG: DUF3427 domain-containing protein [Planctomycetota bacterium JB042]